MHLCKTYFIVREHLVSSSSWTQHYQLTKIMLKNRQNKKSHYWLLAEHEILTVLTLFKYRHVLTHPSYLLSSLHKLHFTSYFTLNIFVKSFLGKTKLTLCSSCLTSPHHLLKEWAKAKVNSNWKQSSPMGDEPSFLFTCTSNSAKNGARRQLHQRQLSAYLSVTSNLDKTAVFDAPEMIMMGSLLVLNALHVRAAMLADWDINDTKIAFAIIYFPQRTIHYLYTQGSLHFDCILTCNTQLSVSSLSICRQSARRKHLITSLARGQINQGHTKSEATYQNVWKPNSTLTHPEEAPLQLEIS